MILSLEDNDLQMNTLKDSSWPLNYQEYHRYMNSVHTKIAKYGSWLCAAKVASGQNDHRPVEKMQVKRQPTKQRAHQREDA